MRPVTVTLALGVLLLAACGSESGVQVTPAPRIPRSVARSLAARSDALASTLRSGSACSAKTAFHELEHQARLAVSSGRVPVVYRQKLLRAVTQLAGRLPRCVPAPPPAPPPPAAPPAPLKPKSKPKPKPPEPPKHHPHHKPHGKGGNG